MINPIVRKIGYILSFTCNLKVKCFKIFKSFLLNKVFDKIIIFVTDIQNKAEQQRNFKPDIENCPFVSGLIKKYGYVPSPHSLEFYQELEEDEEESDGYPPLYDPEDPAGYPGRSD